MRLCLRYGGQSPQRRRSVAKAGSHAGNRESGVGWCLTNERDVFARDRLANLSLLPGEEQLLVLLRPLTDLLELLRCVNARKQRNAIEVRLEFLSLHALTDWSLTHSG